MPRRLVTARPTPAIPSTSRGTGLSHRAPAVEGTLVAPDTLTDPEARWQALRAQAAGCRECPLGFHATQTVWGEGDLHAPLMLVGEQPGDQEDRQGRPFVGPAGQLLARALEALGWPRERLYVTNALTSSPA